MVGVRVPLALPKRKLDMKLPKVISKYPEDVNMISFKQFRNWEMFNGFQYDWIMNKRHIEPALNYHNLHLIDPNIDWEDDVFLMEDSSIREGLKHPVRVAALIKLVLNGGGVVPISIDTFTSHICRSCIPNGHHRVRMLQYLKYTHFPAYCCGDVDLIDPLVDPNVDRLIEFIGG